MDHELVLENSNSAIVYTLQNTIINLKAIKYLNITQRQIYNPFYSNVTFLYTLKKSENLRFFDVFRKYRKVTLDQNGLNLPGT